jgi:Zn-dependent protease with chaperone function
MGDLLRALVWMICFPSNLATTNTNKLGQHDQNAGWQAMRDNPNGLTRLRFAPIKSASMKTVLFWLVFGTGVWFPLCLARADEPVVAAQTNAQITSTNASVVAVPVPGEKAVRHYHASIAVGVTAIIWNFLSPALFLFTGWSARIRSWAERQRQNWYFTFVLYALAFGLIFFLVNLPLNYYAGFLFPHNFDLTNQTFSRWLGNTLKSATVVMVIGLAVGWILFLIIKKSPRRWWLWLGLLVPLFLCVQSFIQPVLIDPLFHQFRPLQDKALESKVLALATRVGIHGSRVYEVNMSQDTKLDEAYVTGLLGTRRIVFWDTMLKNFNDDELLFILGHEMGHYVLHHIIQLIAFASLLAFLSFYAWYWLAGPVIRRCQRWWRFDTLSDFAALPLLILAFQLSVMSDRPVYMAFSRHIEHEADRFGLELTHNNHAAATAFVKLVQDAVYVYQPAPIIQFWYGSHPTPAERIEFFNTYHPWETGQPSKYQEYFQP